MSFFRRPRRPGPEPRPSSYDNVGAVFAELNVQQPTTYTIPFRVPLPPGVGSPQDYDVHGGKVTALVKDFPSLRDRQISGLAYDLGPRRKSDPRFGELTARESSMFGENTFGTHRQELE